MRDERIIATIFAAIDELNQLLPEEQRLAKSLNTVLSGHSGQLDSIGLVNLIVATEQKIQEEFAVPIALADERAMSQENSPFRTIGALANYISSLLDENSND